MNIDQLHKLANTVEVQATLDEFARVPIDDTLAETLTDRIYGENISLDSEQIIVVERVNQDFYRECKVRLSRFGFSKLAYDKVRACRTKRIFIIRGIDNISNFIKSIVSKEDFYQALSKVESQKVNYREPDYYNYYWSFEAIEDDYDFEEESEEVSREELYEGFLTGVIYDDYEPEFNENKPLSGEFYEEIDSWVELQWSGERLENDQIASKRIKGHALVRKMEFYPDNFFPIGEESCPYIKEVIVGRNLMTVKNFVNMSKKLDSEQN